MPVWAFVVILVVVIAVVAVATYFLARSAPRAENPPTVAASTSTSVQTAVTTSPNSAVTSSPETPTGRELKVGVVTTMTGELAVFGKADMYCVDRWREAMTNGLVAGDGKNHPVNFIVEDCASDSNRAAQVTSDLVQNVRVDMVIAAGPPTVTLPVADACENLGVPCFCVGGPWESWFYGLGQTPEAPFKWAFFAGWAASDLVRIQTTVWKRFSTNGMVAALWPATADGAMFAAGGGFDIPSAATDAGYTVVDPGRFPVGTTDFTAMISTFKAKRCEILTGALTPADFATFWMQAARLDWKPKVAIIDQAIGVPQQFQVLGDAGIGLMTEAAWTPAFQLVSSLTGETSRELADDFEQKTGQQWTQALMDYAAGEVVIDVLARANNLDDPQSILTALRNTSVQTIAGQVAFTGPVGADYWHPAPNVSTLLLTMGQWVRGSKWPYDLIIVDNTTAPGIATEKAPEPLP